MGCPECGDIPAYTQPTLTLLPEGGSRVMGEWQMVAPKTGRPLLLLMVLALEAGFS